MQGIIVAVSRKATHNLSKNNADSIRLIAGHGVEGDAHAGATVKHRSRVAKGPGLPNLRQVHLIHEELIAELQTQGFRVGPGVMGENVTTRGVDLLALPEGAILRLGAEARVRVTGLRNPCHQLDDYQKGLMKAVLGRDAQGELVRKSGVMGVVLEGGDVRPGDAIRVEPPPGPHRSLIPV